MIILLDTNVLVRMANPEDRDHSVAIGAVRNLRIQKKLLRLVPQVLYEFWVVGTRNLAANGLGFSVENCDSLVGDFLNLFPLLEDQPGLFREWRKLVAEFSCQGKISHDARIVAAMNKHQVTQILTFNGGDFSRFPGIQILHPNNLPEMED